MRPPPLVTKKERASTLALVEDFRRLGRVRVLTVHTVEALQTTPGASGLVVLLEVPGAGSAEPYHFVRGPADGASVEPHQHPTPDGRGVWTRLDHTLAQRECSAQHRARREPSAHASLRRPRRWR